MNRYPLWANLLIALTVLLGVFYAVPNLYGEVAAVQISSAKASIKLDEANTTALARETLQKAGVPFTSMAFDEKQNTLRVFVSSVDIQIKAKDTLQRALIPNPDDPAYVIALNQISKSPKWMHRLGANAMSLGLDLRGGVHFLLQVDMHDALSKRMDAIAANIRTSLREKELRTNGISRDKDTIVIRLKDAAQREKVQNLISDHEPDLQFVTHQEGDEQVLVASLKPASQRAVQEKAIEQNITTLRNRVNALGVSEPIIQQQGADRILVQLAGVQDVAMAKEMIGRTATLEVRLVDEQAEASGDMTGVDVFPERTRDGRTRMVPVKRQVVLTGERFVSAVAGTDSNNQPDVSVELDAAGGHIMRQVTEQNLKKQMAIILVERKKGEAISVATIQGEFGRKFQITGRFSQKETSELAILIRSGSLAAPMEIIEERVIGPSMGKENIDKGVNSTLWGFIAIALFMILYYALFGSVSVLALTTNLVLLVAILSWTGATMTLPGIAAIAFTLGMAIDSNVLINERIREELRNGSTPQAAIAAGYDRAFGTILDSNVTTFAAGLALLAFGSGPVRGFAVVHCLGIATSMFSAVLVSRAITNLIYGRRRKIEKLWIGQVWKPDAK